MRIATFNADLERRGPGLLLRDILKGDDPQLAAMQTVVAAVSPDILVLQGVDYDHGHVTLTALRDMLGQGGPDYPYIFARQPNTGVPSGRDLDGDGRRHGPADSHGFGRFAGQAGMAILSRYPLDAAGAQDFSTLRWADLPDALLPTAGGKPFPSEEAQAVQRLSSVAHWTVPVTVGETRLQLLTCHATPPVFDGPEDRNGRRNHDELRFWQLYLDGRFGPAPTRDFVLLGDFNLDPVDGAGRKAAIRRLLADPRLQDVRPARPGPAAPDPGHRGDPRLDTAAWQQPEPGHLRVDYILPSADLAVTGAGVYWPPGDSPEGRAAAAASRHRMVWADVVID